MAASRKIRVGTIGYGGAFNMGKRHIELLTEHRGFVPEAVCDLDPSRLEEAQRDWPGIATYTDLDTMLAESDVELLVIVLPHNVHADITIQCLKAGRHVVVEKPFAITVAECDAMIREARKRKLVLSTYHNRHWDPAPVTFMKHLAKIGTPYRWSSQFSKRQQPRDWWRSSKEISGGVIYDWGAHIVEWMLQAMPYEITEISGFGHDGYWPFTNEDELQAVVRFGPNGVGMHTASNLDVLGNRDFAIIGTEGAIHGDHGRMVLTKPMKSGSLRHEELPTERGQGHLYYKNIHGHFFRDEELIITPEWARRVIQVVDYASQSFVSGTAKKPKYP